jgi:hypothetical protein
MPDSSVIHLSDLIFRQESNGCYTLYGTRIIVQRRRTGKS